MPDETRPTVGQASPGPLLRRFTVRDAMIIVAAAAVGGLGYRANDAIMVERGYVWGSGGAIEGWVILGGPGLAALTAGLAVARLLSPHPPRIDLFRQPGFAAVCVALALTARRFAEAMLADWLVRYDDWFLSVEWPKAIQEASLGILTAWSVLALAGCLRAERGWIDRGSRAVALLWVLAGIASRLVPLIEWAWSQGL
jgi:hypothetical protein